ncbi:ATP-binding cassette domain-containing protein [Deinococcus malanensis]|uniref:ABC transporter ATP-binding protein n=1 Tax=Deinococcus malanensis TaxID=1706855 RepID=UPI00166429A9|nr:ATP-binding cassette domain-containing protein [Deinococcus malanensis]
MLAPLLDVQNLQISPGRRVSVQLPSLQLNTGDLLHLRGSNGAGKTTLLRALAGDQPYQGQIRIAGSRPGSVQARRHTAFVPTDPELPGDLTVREWLEFLAAAWSQPARPLLSHAQQFGLNDWLEDWPTSLSRGTRQKVALAAALGLRCGLTLLDEPFGTLDAASREALRRAIGRHVAQGGAVIVVTHGDELEGLDPRRLDLSLLPEIS